MLKLLVVVSAAIILAVEGTCSVNQSNSNYKQLLEKPAQKSKNCRVADTSDAEMNALIKKATPLIPEAFVSDYVFTWGGVHNNYKCQYDFKGSLTGFKLEVAIYQSNCLRNGDKDCDPFDGADTQQSYLCNVILFPFDFYFNSNDCRENVQMLGSN